MNVGFAQSVITPSLKKPVFLAGFGTDRRAQTVHDDLYARAVAMQSDQTTMVLVALDLIGFMKTDVQEVIECMHKSHPQGRLSLLRLTRITDPIRWVLGDQTGILAVWS